MRTSLSGTGGDKEAELRRRYSTTSSGVMRACGAWCSQQRQPQHHDSVHSGGSPAQPELERWILDKWTDAVRCRNDEVDVRRTEALRLAQSVVEQQQA